MNKVKELFRNHCESKGFRWSESRPMVSVNPKLLFNISGGVIFEEIISSGIGVGSNHPRTASVQRCLRTDGWKKIGISGRHHLSFEMLGHFSFFELGEYQVKELMIGTALSFLIDRVGLNSKYLIATAHPLDSSSLDVLSRRDIDVILNEENVTATPEQTRCGFRTEIVWKPSLDWKVELWNLVFTQFQGAELFVSPLKVIACDSGASLDRIVTAAEGFKSDYDNSNWRGLVAKLSQCTATMQDRVKINRLADLGKAAVLLIKEGLEPSNKVAGYVLRKIIRDAYVHCQLASISFCDYCLICCNWWNNGNSQEEIIKILAEEARKFDAGLDRGMKEYRRMIERYEFLRSEQYEYLSSTYGIPQSLIELRSRSVEGGDK